MTILPLYAAPQFAPQVTDWLWQAFGGETLPRQFFASIVQHSQTAEALPLTFIMPAARAFGSSISTPPAGISMNASAGATSARGWITRPPPCTSIAMTYRLPAGRPPSDDGPASG